MTALGSEPLIFSYIRPPYGRSSFAVNALFRTYFASGGLRYRAMLLTRNLMAAQNKQQIQEPAGALVWLNAYFVDLSTVHQNEFIKQTRAM